MKILVIGLARHGKDTVVDYLSDKYHMNYMSTSAYYNKLFVYPILKNLYNYKTEEECFEDRVNHRGLWYDIIKTYNTIHNFQAFKDLLKTTDIFVGTRSQEEYQMFLNETEGNNLVLYIDAFERLGQTEGLDSFSLKLTGDEIVISNNGSLEELYKQIDTLISSKRFIKIKNTSDFLEKIKEASREFCNNYTRDI